MTFYEKLSDIQMRLKAPKSQYNSFGKYNYRNCEDILEAVKPLLNELIQSTKNGDSIEKIDSSTEPSVNLNERIAELLADPLFNLRPEQLSLQQFVDLTRRISAL